MYNKELKERFLEQYNEDSAKTYRDSLTQISETEEFYNKDIFNFTYEQLDEAFKSIKAKTLAGVRRIVSPTLEYIRWANQNGYIKSKIDITSLFGGDKIKEYVWSHALKNSYITREELYDMCSYLVNDMDKAILVMAFEGIDSKEHYAMRSLKGIDIQFGTGEVKIHDSKDKIRSIIIKDKRSLDILQDATNQLQYLFNNGESTAKNKVELLENTPFILRKIERPIIDDEIDVNDKMVTANFLSRKSTVFFKGKQNPKYFDDQPYIPDGQFININNIFKSGFFDYCLNMENEKNGDLTTQDYLKICERFGINAQIMSNYKKQYLDWEKNNK